MDQSPILVTGSDGVVRVTLNRPRARNAVDLGMCHALRAVFERLTDHPDVRAVVVDGTGPAFCAGADLRERADKDAAWVAGRRRAAFAAYAAIERCPHPVVASVHGPVIGSGGEIALSCDFVIADRSASFRFPEPHWGTVGATQRLQRAVGRRRAKELLFTNRALDAQAAHELGLVTVLVDELDAGTEHILGAIRAAPPLALRLTKQAIDQGAEATLEQGIRIEAAAIDRVLMGAGWQEGVRAFTAQVGSADRGARTDDEERR